VRATLFLLAALVSSAVAGPAAAQAIPKDCDKNPTSLECLSYSGTTSSSKSQSGNVGGALQERSGSAPPKYVVFIHAGKARQDLAKNVEQALSAKGYIVRGIDDDQDPGEPRVDYFRDDDLSGAKEIAGAVNALAPAAKLEPHRSKAANPPGFIGLWLGTK
jgi:hypothetical protein